MSHGRLERETPSSVDAVLRGGGAMGALMRALDWSKTDVGPVESWPQSLRTALSILLETGFPMYIAWGPSFTQFYNDGYRPILGSTKHPAAMGISTRETFAEIWDIIGPMFHGVMEGKATTVVGFLLPLDRHGFVEECYFVFSYSPIREESGAVGGVLVTVTETTRRVLGERRLETSQALAARTKEAANVAEACSIAASVLAENPLDLPFTLIFLVDDDERTASLAGAAGVSPGDPGVPLEIELDDDSAPWPLRAAIASRERVIVDLPAELTLASETANASAPPPADLPAPTRAAVLPIVEQGTGRALGVLVAALSPRLMLDDDYQRFQAHLASQIGTSITTARALEEATARAEALLALDRAKTAFFSNVSHEFRTPLTLMLGPTEDALASPERALRGEDLEVVHRNELRLLKLVNSLLDFSRIEAGRMTAAFEPTDLAAVTIDLASTFRSAVERAGLSLVVDCPPLPAAVFVDRGQWEKIVLNLLSNALKFTFEGSIRVELGASGDRAKLTVRDTGVGIPEDELPHIFERFRRVTSSRARTHEGSGIGLSLVRELVTMHGGTLEASSCVGAGTTFEITLPFGRRHLPSDQVKGASLTRHETSAPAFVHETLRWLPEGSERADDDGAQPSPSPDVRILVVDDNADMRGYLVRLLRERWSVEAVGDGLAALEAVRRAPPHLVVADVMMPGLDGFELLSRLRRDEATRALPVVLLSARAGEEARLEGLKAGADDYLVKPFSARELVARVEAQIAKAQVRSVEEAHSLRLASVFEQAPVGVAILRGPHHVFEVANERYRELVGGRAVVGRPIRQALPELAGQGIYELLDGVFESGVPYEGRSLGVWLDRGDARRQCFFDFVYQPLLDDEGAVDGIAVVAFEVTDLVHAQREAESANRAKDEFLAMLSHELRNPLAPILTALELMRLGDVDVAERGKEVIERQVRNLTSLVDDLLDVSRIARGGVKLTLERYPVADLVDRAIEMVAPAIEGRRHQLAVEVPRDLTMVGDVKRLSQVLANLLSNAAKYTDPGGHIELRVVREGASILFLVKDDGVGIAPEMLPCIFDRFVQERQSIERSQGGLGLGLSIVKSLVEAHQGEVVAESPGRGRGTTMTVRLPLDDAAESPPPPATEGARAPRRRGLPLLLVDDDEEAGAVLAGALRELGHDVRVAHDGPEALRLLETFRPAAGLIDAALPVMDGCELAARLRADATYGDLYLVAVTSYGRPDDDARFREAGFDAHVVKPVSAHPLDRLLRKGVGDRAAERVSAPTA